MVMEDTMIRNGGKNPEKSHGTETGKNKTIWSNMSSSATNGGSSIDKPRSIFEDNMPIVWLNVIIMVYLHGAAVIGLYYWFSGKSCWQTIATGFFWGYLGAFGITCGAHRLWAHKCYKAKLPLRILLAFMQTVACQNSIHEWCRDHRVHHKFSETDADPHNAKRGFFFAHVGWLLCKKHKDVKIRGKAVDMSDLEADPVVMFQKKYFIPLTITFTFIIPTMIPCYFWNEDGWIAWYMTILKYVLALNATWLVNSAAHLWGNHPYDNNINPAENKFVSIVTPGEGWHNYHHTFPWDYKAAELGQYKTNWSTCFIDFFAWIGLAYDLKTVPESIVRQRVQRTGDGTHPIYSSKASTENDRLAKNQSDKNDNYISPFFSPSTWGWDDKDVSQADRNLALIHYRKSIGKEEE